MDALDFPDPDGPSMAMTSGTIAPSLFVVKRAALVAAPVRRSPPEQVFGAPDYRPPGTTAA
ncbi:hypothetical protein GCM10010177_09020 [Actinomadura citrea]|nr:hypothetical protein GCM10010177_09020 [Actinomadura citrea]